jgi:hypothetical protein
MRAGAGGRGMSAARTVLAVLFSGVLLQSAGAADFSFNGMADVRLFVPPKDGSYLVGDLGKERFGYDNGGASASFVQGIGEGRVLITPEVLATATARFDPNYGPAVDLIEAWVRYRPVSTSSWRWSVKAGAFFPPISLENDEIGWTSFWTLTPSAINSWLGSEIRIIGTEGTLEWRRNGGTLTLIGALFARNENAGEFITDRGWNMDDRVTGLYEQSRLPDAGAVLFGGTPPLKTHLFKQFDDHPGWYLDLSWEPEDIGGFEIMRYDNNADPAVTRGDDVAWHTTFWDAGFRKQIGHLTLLSQAMSGATEIHPNPSFRLVTDFRGAYALAGWDMDVWWLAARIDWFQTRTYTPGPTPMFSEDGHAGTISASWLPWKWLRLTSEFLLVDSTRPERAVTGDAPRQIEKQFQLAGRIYF